MTETQRSITTMWSVVGVTTLYISMNIYFNAHGSEFFLPSIKLDETDHYSASFYGVFFTLPLVLTTHYLTRVYAKNYGKGIWYFHLPIAFNRELSELEEFLRMYQLFFFILLLIIPSLLHVDFFNKFFHGTVYIESTGEAVLVAWEQFTFDLSIYSYGINNFRYGDIDIGIDYFPILFPLAIIIAETIHLYSLVATLKAIGILSSKKKMEQNN